MADYNDNINEVEEVEELAESEQKRTIVFTDPNIILKKYILPEFQKIYEGPTKVLLQLKKFFDKGVFDIAYFIVVILLTAFGNIIYYSASGEIDLTQILVLALGIPFMIFLSQVNVNVYKDMSSALMAVATVLLILVLIMSDDVNGTHRWINLGIEFQPSEIGKITLILWLAYLMDKYKDKRRNISTFIIFFALVCGYACLVLAESHLSGCILFFLIGATLMWYNNMNKSLFIFIGAVGIIALIVVIADPNIMTKLPGVKEYQTMRILTWKKILLNQELTRDERLNDARQVLQSLYGIGSGGLIGAGYGNSAQKINNLQEEGNDFIFAVIGEELGLFGGLLMLALFGVLVWRGFNIAYKAKSRFASLVALGISTQMALQVLLNVAVATSLVPNTGISLPFFSGGGTSLLISMVSMGIMLAISKDMKREKSNVK